MHQSGVGQDVIDLIVALSYPNRFIVERRQRDAPVLTPFWVGRIDPFLSSPYYYAPFAYSSGVPAGVWGLTTPGDVLWSDVAPRPRPSGEGRVVNDLGYTRVRPRTAEPPAGASATGSPQAGRTAGDASGGAGSPSGGSSGGGTVSPQGYSGGGGSADSGRTAVPR